MVINCVGCEHGTSLPMDDGADLAEVFGWEMLDDAALRGGIFLQFPEHAGQMYYFCPECRADMQIPNPLQGGISPDMLATARELLGHPPNMLNLPNNPTLRGTHHDDRKQRKQNERQKEKRRRQAQREARRRGRGRRR